MKRVMLILIFAALNLRAVGQDMPKYYFDIEDICTTSFSFEGSSEEETYRFRALSINPENYSFIVLELISLGSHDQGGKKLVSSYSLRENDFDVYLISSVEFIEWKSPKKLIVKLNEHQLYLIDLSNYKRKIKVKKM